MPVFKDEKRGTWYVMAWYRDWTGAHKQKCKRGFPTKREAQERLDTIIRQIAESQGVTEVLKAADPMAWVGRMNNIQACAREIVDEEIIYA